MDRIHHVITCSVMIGLLLVASCQERVDEENNVEKVETIRRYEGEMSDVIASVYTSKRQVALTFNGMADEETMMKLLDKLDEHGMKATFFLPGMRVAEEPEIAKAIQKNGHEIENNTLNGLQVENLTYDEPYKEIELSQRVIANEVGVLPRYVRTKSGDVTDDLRLIAAQLGLDGVVLYSINPRDRDMQAAEEIGAYVKRFRRNGCKRAISRQNGIIKAARSISITSTRTAFAIRCGMPMRKR